MSAGPNTGMNTGLNAGSGREGHRLILIAAVARNGGIGRDNQLLVHLPEDLKHFRRVTQGCPVIMGRRTWDSLPPAFRPLPGRRNIVLSRHCAGCPGAEVAGSIHEALEWVKDSPRAFVIGGAEIYRQALPHADELILTEIDADLPADTFFPDWPRDRFVEVSRVPPEVASGASAPQGPSPGGAPMPPYAFVTYSRRSAAG